MYGRTLRCASIVSIALCAISVARSPAQDVGAGERSFRKCQPCHDVGQTAKNKIGPVLNGLDGRKAGSVEGYSYSNPNKESDITWKEATFKEYIADPGAKIPGTKMVFPGIKNDKESDDLWAYLKQYKMDGSK